MKKRKYEDEKSLTVERVRSLLSYDETTGVFRWCQKSSNVQAGTIAGSKNASGYVIVRVAKCQVYAHKLAWFYVHGQWPDGQVDHINGKRDDNSIGNLRVVNQSQNSCNGTLRSTNTSGYRGVSWSKEKKKWVSRIVKDRKQYVLGYFASKEEAYDAYLEAARDLHGEYSRKD